MAIVVLTIREDEEGVATISATFDPPVSKDAATNHPDDLPAAHFVGLGLLEHAASELGDEPGEVTVESSQEGGE